LRYFFLFFFVVVYTQPKWRGKSDKMKQAKDLWVIRKMEIAIIKFLIIFMKLVRIGKKRRRKSKVRKVMTIMLRFMNVFLDDFFFCL
jgi:hypothetical protein